MGAGKHTEETRRLEAGDAAYRIMGLAVIALVPALFWTAVVAAAGTATGNPLSTAMLATVFAAIATFLFTAVSALFARIS